MKKNRDRGEIYWWDHRVYRSDSDLRWHNLYGFKPIENYFDFWALDDRGKIIGDG